MTRWEGEAAGALRRLNRLGAVPRANPLQRRSRANRSIAQRATVKRASPRCGGEGGALIHPYGYSVKVRPDDSMSGKLNLSFGLWESGRRFAAYRTEGSELHLDRSKTTNRRRQSVSAFKSKIAYARSVNPLRA